MRHQRNKIPRTPTSHPTVPAAETAKRRAAAATFAALQIDRIIATLGDVVRRPDLDPGVSERLQMTRARLDAELAILRDTRPKAKNEREAFERLGKVIFSPLTKALQSDPPGDDE